MKKFFLTVLATIFLGFPSFTYAISTQEDIDQLLTSIEDERTAKIEAELSITLPIQTDNPNHIVSFKDPSGEGVKLEIDGQGYKKITSPYTLPSLGIGKHTLAFRFTDSEETSQTLEKTLIVIPRPPVLQAPEKITTTEITLSGTALAGSTVEIFLASGTTSVKDESIADSSGSWMITLSGDYPYGIYNIVALTKKNGFASEFSETTTFEITKAGSSTAVANDRNQIYFAFSELNKDNIVTTLKSNLDLVYLFIASVFLGLASSLLIGILRQNYLSKKVEGHFLNFLSKKEDVKDDKKKVDETEKDTKVKEISKTMTLREKFEKAGLEDAKEGVKKQVHAIKEEKKAEKVVSKKEFMEKFKNEDPDDAKGKETKELEKKETSGFNLMKNLKISLTSDKPKKK